MNARAQKILTDVQHLPPEERIELAEGILATIESPTLQELDASWAREAEDRLAAVSRGELQLIPGELVFEKIRKKRTR